MGNNDKRAINAMIAATLCCIIGVFDFIRRESVELGAIARLWRAVEGRVARPEAALPPSTEPDARANAHDASPASAAEGPSGGPAWVPATDHPPGEDLTPAPADLTPAPADLTPAPAEAPTTAAPKSAPPAHAASAGRGSTGVQPRQPSVRNVSTSGPVDQGLIRRILRAHINEIRHCYAQGLQRDPTLRGSLTVTWTITQAGRAAGVAIMGPGLDAMLDACAVSSIARWNFPRAPEPTAVVGTFKLSPRK